MRASVSLSLVICAGLAAGAFVAPTAAPGQTPPKRPKSSPAVVVFQVFEEEDDEIRCDVWPKSVTIVSSFAPAGTKGPKKVRFFYARGDSDVSAVEIKPKAGQAHPDILDLPKIPVDADKGDSSETKKKLSPGAPDYTFHYEVEIKVDSQVVTCDPDIVIKKPGG